MPYTCRPTYWAYAALNFGCLYPEMLQAMDPHEASPASAFRRAESQLCSAPYDGTQPPSHFSFNFDLTELASSAGEAPLNHLRLIDIADLSSQKIWKILRNSCSFESVCDQDPTCEIHDWGGRGAHPVQSSDGRVYIHSSSRGSHAISWVIALTPHFSDDSLTYYLRHDGKLLMGTHATGPIFTYRPSQVPTFDDLAESL